MKNTIPAVDRTLYLLELLNKSENGLTQAQLTQGAEVSTTTGYRILQTLLAHGWIERNAAGRFILCGKIPGKQDPLRQLLDNAQPVLDQLAQKTHLSCKLSIREGNQQISVLRADSPEPFAITGKIGARFPLIEGTVGAVLLSDSAKEEILYQLKNESEDIPEKNDPEIIFSRIKRLKSEGWVINRTPSRWRVQAMSIPVFLEKKVCAALTLIGLHDDFLEPGQYVKSLKQAQKQLHKITGE